MVRDTPVYSGEGFLVACTCGRRGPPQANTATGGEVMVTVVSRENMEVRISTEGPVIMIGERINPTGHKKLAQALKERDFQYVRELAARQVTAGAQVLDVNTSVPGLDEVALLPEVVRIVAEQVPNPLCLDSNNPAALAAALAVCPGKALVNSVNGEQAKLQAVLPLVRDHGAAVIGLTMDDRGIPPTAEARLAIAETILQRAGQLGIPEADLLIDPLVLTVGADQKAAVVTLKTIELVRTKLGLNVNLGASNVSFGLPDRQTINQAFLALSFAAGATCVITDPERLAGTILASDLLLGRDPYGKRYLAHVRRVLRARDST
jgi:5-methyltetrahydrofolate--homocysteine methyltransferase